DHRACHVSASIGKETARPAARCRCLPCFQALPFRKGFRNEFPYLGRAGRAAKAGCCPACGDRSKCHVAEPPPPRPAAPAACFRGTKGEARPQGGAEGGSRSTGSCGATSLAA